MAKILVVDDHFGIRRMLFETFCREQHEAEMAENGAEALRLFITFEPDLILMDMKMPGIVKRLQHLVSRISEYEIKQNTGCSIINDCKEMDGNMGSAS